MIFCLDGLVAVVLVLTFFSSSAMKNMKMLFTSNSVTG